MKYINLILIIILLLGCSNKERIEATLRNSTGISKVVSINSDWVVFLANLKDFYSTPAIVFFNRKENKATVNINTNCKVRDVNQSYYNLTNYNGYTYFIYEDFRDKFTVETYYSSNKKSIRTYNSNQFSYGYFFKVDGSEESLFCRSSMSSSNNVINSYLYNYYYLDVDNNLYKSGLIDLGGEFPEKLTLCDDYVYYIIDKELKSYSINTKKIQSIYKFDSKVIDIRNSEDIVYILTKDRVFIVENNKVAKGLKIANLLEGDYATSITSINSGNLSVEIFIDGSYQYKVFTRQGNQINEYNYKYEKLGDTFIWDDQILYSDGNSIILNSL